jgi:hypothetical protein
MQIPVPRTETEAGNRSGNTACCIRYRTNVLVLSGLKCGGRTVLAPHVEPEGVAILKGGGAVLADCRLLANVLRSDVTAQAAPVDPAAAVVAFNVRP